MNKVLFVLSVYYRKRGDGYSTAIMAVTFVVLMKILVCLNLLKVSLPEIPDGTAWHVLAIGIGLVPFAIVYFTLTQLFPKAKVLKVKMNEKSRRDFLAYLGLYFFGFLIFMGVLFASNRP